ncbi:MAG: ribonuclease HII [Armatimonadetes bacterium]|nr:ribonuclease HII [Armatimonadota bacterium]
MPRQLSLHLDVPPLRPTWDHERRARLNGCLWIAGVDEAGRGPIAGPVMAAAVVLPFECSLDGLNDSKMLTCARRERLFERITEAAEGVGVGVVDVETIDRINILKASHEAMRLALASVREKAGCLPDFALVDGYPVPSLPCRHEGIVKGDRKSVSIAAASVIAKVTRDRLMDEMDTVYPGYGFARHKGYGTAEHLACLDALGPCPIHRKSFAPVAERSASLER